MSTHASDPSGSYPGGREPRGDRNDRGGDRARGRGPRTGGGSGNGRRPQGPRNGNGNGNGNGGMRHTRGDREFDARDETFGEDEVYAQAHEEAPGERTYVRELKAMSVKELTDLAEQLEIENAAGLRKQDLIFAILKCKTENNHKVFAEGVLEILPDGYGFLRAPD